MINVMMTIHLGQCDLFITEWQIMNQYKQSLMTIQPPKPAALFPRRYFMPE